MKKICFVIGALTNGGAERVVTILANEFYLLGYEVKIVTIIDSSDQNTYEVEDGIEIIKYIKKGSNSIDIIFRTFFLRRYFISAQPDVIIPFTTEKNISVLMATALTKFRVISCERNDPKNDPKNIVLRILRKILYINSSGFVFQTKEAKNYFSEKIQVRSCIIPNPIKEEIIQPWKGTRDNKIVMVSRLNPQKNIEMAIEVMASISEKNPEFRLEIYGKSCQGSYDYENSLKKKVLSRNLEKTIKFKGFTTDVHEAINNATVFLITSNHEGMSNSLMEALALGLPCISTDDPNGGARALIVDHENGILIPVGDTNRCIEAIEELLSNKELRDTLSSNAIRIREEFSLDKIAAKWIEYINYIIR